MLELTSSNFRLRDLRKIIEPSLHEVEWQQETGNSEWIHIENTSLLKNWVSNLPIKFQFFRYYEIVVYLIRQTQYDLSLLKLPKLVGRLGTRNFDKLNITTRDLGLSRIGSVKSNVLTSRSPTAESKPNLL